MSPYTCVHCWREYRTELGLSGHLCSHALNPNEPPPVTIFLCGPSKCEHDYSGEDYAENRMDEHGNWVVTGWTSVCTKCGARAIDEAAWS